MLTPDMNVWLLFDYTLTTLWVHFDYILTTVWLWLCFLCSMFGLPASTTRCVYVDPLFVVYYSFARVHQNLSVLRWSRNPVVRVDFDFDHTNLTTTLTTTRLESSRFFLDCSQSVVKVTLGSVVKAVWSKWRPIFEVCTCFANLTTLWPRQSN